MRDEDGNNVLVEACLSGVAVRPLCERVRRSSASQICVRRLQVGGGQGETVVFSFCGSINEYIRGISSHRHFLAVSCCTPPIDPFGWSHMGVVMVVVALALGDVAAIAHTLVNPFYFCT